MKQKMSKAEQNRQTQSGSKHRKKSSDLRRCLKAVSNVDEAADCSICAKPRLEMSNRQWWSADAEQVSM